MSQAVVAIVVVVGLLSAAAMIPSSSPPSSGGGAGAGGGGGSGVPGGGDIPLEDLPVEDLPSIDPPEGGVGNLPVEPGALTPPDEAGVGNIGGAGSGGVPGGIENLSNSVHFTVDAERASYWRTGSYGQYTGEGWTRSGDASPYEPEVTGAGRTLVQEVTLRRGATALPAAWRPRSVSFPDGSDAQVYVTDHGSLSVPQGLSSSATYRVVSDLQTMDPEVLRSATGEYPDRVQQYTELPDDTPERVERFTSRLTREADDAYETARMVELWLERNKTYSLNVSHDASRPVADQFVFEMERGYCEYFATSMAVMLRSQGIPARYVVGYAPGQRARNGSIVVRARDAHAWTEVYFPDVGWVRFDPTPAASRRGQERETMPANRTGRRPIVPGSPGEGIGGGEGSLPELPSINGDGEGNGSEPVPRPWMPSPPYQVQLNETPIPGDLVTATVTKDGRPVEGVVVTFEGDPVGRTNRNGNVTARVPYVENLTVEARVPAGVEPGSDGDGIRASRSLTGPRASGSESKPEPASPPSNRDAPRSTGAGSGRLTELSTSGPDRVSIGRPTLSGRVQSGWDTAGTWSGARQDGQEGDSDDPDGDSERTYDVATDVSLTVEGPFAPGRSPVLVATIEGVPVRDARVTLAGETVGRTDDRGRIRVEIPETLRNDVRVGVDRGEVVDRDRLSLETLSLDVRPHTVLALPGQGATVEASVGEYPVEDVAVYVDGQRVGTTDEDGELRITFPVENAVEVRGDGPVLSTTTRIWGLFVTAAVLAGLLLSVVVAGLVAVGRRAPDAGAATDDARSLLGRIRAALARGVATVADWAVGAAIAAGGVLHAAGRAALAAGRRLGRGLRAGIRRAMAVQYTALAASGLSWTRRALARAIVGIGRLGYRLLLTAVPPYGSDSEGPPRQRPGPGHAGRPNDDGRRERSIRALWGLFVRTLRVARPETKTPGEIARHAVDRGFPEPPVNRLTEAFRTVEYGPHEETDGLRERAAAALDRIRDRDGTPESRRTDDASTSGTVPAGDRRGPRGDD